jgi:membrane protein YdbS with pleckstrin-like domain
MVSRGMRRISRSENLTAPCREQPASARVERSLTERAMLTILLVILVLILIGALPAWPYSSGWGYYPSGGIGLVVVVLVVLLLMGRI